MQIYTRICRSQIICWRKKDLFLFRRTVDHPCVISSFRTWHFSRRLTLTRIFCEKLRSPAQQSTIGDDRRCLNERATTNRCPKAPMWAPKQSPDDREKAKREERERERERESIRRSIIPNALSCIIPVRFPPSDKIREQPSWFARMDINKMN